MIAILRAVAALVAIAMLASSLVAYAILRRADNTGVLVLKSHRALEAAEETLRRSVDAESSARGYVLTRDPADLAPFDRADQTIQHAIDDLQDQVGGDTERQRVQSLRGEVERLFVVLRRLVGRGTDGGAAQARDEARTRMETIRAIVREIRRSESARLDARMQADASAGRSVTWVAIVTAAIAAALVTAAGALALLLIRPGWGRRL